MSERVLVCVLAQTRAHQLTWANFKQNVLDELGADLAVCVGLDQNYDYTNPFWQNATYRWGSPEYEDFGEGFDRAQRHLTDAVIDWRRVLQIKSQWLGGIKGLHQHGGSGGIIIFFRWLLLHSLYWSGVLDKYDRFIITRSDFFWPTPHPPLSVLDLSRIWFPDGEYYGGLTDRHHVISRADLPKVINLIDDIVVRPARLIEQMGHSSDWNLEKYIYWHLQQENILSRVSVFPWVMFSVRGKDDNTRWNWGTFDRRIGMIVKYPTELRAAMKHARTIRTRDDWASQRALLRGAFA